MSRLSRDRVSPADVTGHGLGRYWAYRVGYTIYRTNGNFLFFIFSSRYQNLQNSDQLGNILNRAASTALSGITIDGHKRVLLRALCSPKAFRVRLKIYFGI